MKINIYGIDGKVLKTLDADISNITLSSARRVLEIIEKSEEKQSRDETIILKTVFKEIFPSFADEDYEKLDIKECASFLVELAKCIIERMIDVPCDEEESSKEDEQAVSLSDLLFQMVFNLCHEFTGLSPVSLEKEKFEDVMRLFCDVRRMQIRQKKQKDKPQNTKHYEKRNGKIRCYVPVKE